MNVVDALSYPVRGNGWVIIVAGAIFAVILKVLQFAPYFGFAVAVFSVAYFGAFYLDIISTTMTDSDQVPDWPSLGSFADDILSPVVRLFGLGLISFAPLLGLVIFADHRAPWFPGAVAGGVAYGCIYFPMAVLASQAFGSLAAALPHIVFPGLVRSLPGYLFAVVALVFGFVACGLAQAYTAAVPFVGWFLAAAIALYSLMFQGRLIGLIYRDKKDRLGWE
jgi:hypothetical protein